MSKKAIYNVTNQLKVAGPIASFNYEDKVEKLKVHINFNWKNTFDQIVSTENKLTKEKEGSEMLMFPIMIYWEHEE